MNKFTLGLGLLLALGMSSCKSGGDKWTTTITYTTLNHVSSLTNDEVFVNQSNYSFYFNYTDQVVSVSAPRLVINNNTYSFTSNECPYILADNVLTLKNVVANVTGNSSYVINNGNFSLMLPVSLPQDHVIPGYTGSPINVDAVVCQYDLGNDWRIKTFYPDVTFKGSTTTRYNLGGEKQFMSENILYRILMDREKMTAVLVLYNARFAEEMPIEIAKIVLEDLKLTWTKDGYQISGENVVPSLVENNMLTPFPAYTFESVTITPTNNSLTNVSIDYDVVSMMGGNKNLYEGSFKGSYVN